MRAATRVLALALLPLFGLSLAFLVVEVSVRTLHLVPDRFWQWDHLLGSKLIPNKQGWWTQEEGEFRVPIKVSSQGLRDIEHDVTVAPGRRRIVVLGDSFIEAMQVPLESMFARELEARIGGSDGVDVVSMGTSGYGTAAQYLWFRETGAAYKPDVVVLAFYPGNDIRNNSEVLEPVLPPEYGQDNRPVRISVPKKVERSGGMLGWSSAYRWLRKLVLTQHPELANPLGRVGLLDGDALRTAPQQAGVPVDYGVYASSLTPDWKVAWNRTESTLAALSELISAGGSDFAIVIVTARERIYRDTWDEIREANPAMKSIEWNLDGPERRLLMWCKQQGIPCLALTPQFETRRGTSPALHFRHDGHWTAEGHALAAELTANFLRAHNLIQ